MFDPELERASALLQKSIEHLGYSLPNPIEWLSIPFRGQWGFGSPICFQIAAAQDRVDKKAGMPQIAQEIAEAILLQMGTPQGFTRAEAQRGYLNLYVDSSIYASRVIDAILEQKDAYGRGAAKGERVMVEYSQPNTHKAFHVGHLRNVMLGGAMSNILSFAGYDTVRANYIGDIGWHVIKWMWCYLNFHRGEEPEGDCTHWMANIYAEATQLIDSNPDYEEAARRLFIRWDALDPEILELWKRTRKWSLEGFDQIYNVLGEHFDVVFYESEVEESGKDLVDELIKRGIASDERPEGGPVIVKLDELLGLKKEKYRVLVVLRSDGTSLYATKDLALAIKKFEEWKIDRSIYVIDVRQSLYMSQIFKTLEMMGFEQAKKCHHLAYEIVNLPGNVTISSREGAVVLFNDLIHEAIVRTSSIVDQKNPTLNPATKREIAKLVALGAIKYSMLAVDTNKVATFDWERALDFEGQAAPYIQYAHVRASSILAQVERIPDPIAPDYPLNKEEVALLERLSIFPNEVQRAASEYKPLCIANYVYALARAFTIFYQCCPVLKSEGRQRDFRLRLTAAARYTLANSLGLLGIQAPTVM